MINSDLIIQELKYLREKKEISIKDYLLCKKELFIYNHQKDKSIIGNKKKYPHLSQYIYYTFKNKNLNEIKDPIILSFMVNNLNFDNLTYDLIKDLINQKLYIKDFGTIFYDIAEMEWDSYLEDHSLQYDNLFGRVCSILRNSNNFEAAVMNMDFLNSSDIEEVLDKKYSDFSDAIENYYLVFHSQDENKMEKLEIHRNIISDMLALYLAKSKENFKKEIINSCYEILEPYFCLRLDHPKIKKELTIKKQKEKFKKLYLENAHVIQKLKQDLYKKYSKLPISYKDIHKLRDNFIIKGYSKLEETFPFPNNYLEYVRYQNANQLIKRLNLGNITYDSLEVVNYKDIISYDEKNSEYYYKGVCFKDSEIKLFEEYNLKKEIFLELKRDIINVIKTIEVEEQFDEEKMIVTFPFTDEYFVYDNEYTLNNFTWIEIEKYISDIKK